MPNYRRARIFGGVFFFTVVTHDRRPLLCSDAARACLRQAIQETKATHPFVNEAFCLLPDHLHCIWSLPDGGGDFSTRWRKIKGLFTARFRSSGGAEDLPNASRLVRREASVWQRRFWEHWIRDEIDLRRHLDYIHYNPVKHGHVSNPAAWEWSSFGRFLRDGHYPIGWGEGEEPTTCCGIESEISEP